MPDKDSYEYLEKYAINKLRHEGLPEEWIEKLLRDAISYINLGWDFTVKYIPAHKKDKIVGESCINCPPEKMGTNPENACYGKCPDMYIYEEVEVPDEYRLEFKAGRPFFKRFLKWMQKTLT